MGFIPNGFETAVFSRVKYYMTDMKDNITLTTMETTLKISKKIVVFQAHQNILYLKIRMLSPSSKYIDQ